MRLGISFVSAWNVRLSLEKSPPFRAEKTLNHFAGMGTANAEGSMITSLRQATCLRRCRIMLAVSACLLALPAAAEDPILVRVNAFPNAKALPLHAGMATGIFAKHGLSIDLQTTE